MQDFIRMATQQLGNSEQSATSATGGVLGMVQKAVGGGDFNKLLGGVPGVGDMLGAAGQSGAAGGLGGLLGGAMKTFGGSGGGSLGSLAELTGVFSKAGLSMDKAGPLVGMLFQYLQGKAGNDAVGQILGKMPELKKLIG